MKRLLATLSVAVALLVGPAQAQDDRKTVAVGDLTVSYGEAGEGVPLVLVHGGGLTSRMWGGFAPVAAAAGFHVFTPDTRNHGATDNPSGQFSYDLAAQDLAGFILALGLDRPVLMGYSDGGIIVQNALLAQPDLARAAVIGGATNRVAADDHYMAGMTAFYGYAERGALPEAVLDALVINAPDFAARLQSLHATATEPERWRSLHQLAWPVWTTEMVLPLEAYSAINVPVLVILGQFDDFFLPQDALTLAAAMSRGEIAILPGASHAAFRQRADLFAGLVPDFLARAAAQ